ncbi:MAG: PHP domain-containing protein, partial [Candidatus Zixiibacteriota bacterium]
MSRLIDLHLHTNFSDGLTTPAELVTKVRVANLIAFSVTDHDTLRGYRQVAGMVRGGDPELVT